MDRRDLAPDEQRTLQAGFFAKRGRCLFELELDSTE